MAPTPRKGHSSPPADDEDEARAAAAAAEFGAALEAFEGDRTTEARRSERARDEAAVHRLGSRVRGRVVSVEGEVLLIDIGGRSEAVGDAREFRDASGVTRVSVGDMLELFVVEASEPLVLARTARRQGHASLAALRAARESGLPVRGRVTAVNTGGLAVDVEGVGAFCPLSQVDSQYVEDPACYVGRVLEFLVTEVDESRARVVLSRKGLLQREQQERARARLAELAPGQELEGTITRLEPFGAFVDLGGFEGLVHVSEISHARVEHPREALAAGEKVRVRVLRVEPARDGRPRVALSVRATAPDPWAAAVQRFAVGARVPGVVVRLADFGAFVNLAPGVDGLVHVSQVSDRRIHHVREALSPGQAVEVVVLAVDAERKRLSLSIREALEHPIEPSRVEREREPSETGTPAGPAERPADPEALTPMQLAFRRAREVQELREKTE